jgi:hypothetical protein
MWADVDTCDYSLEPMHDAEYVANAVLGADTSQIILLHDGNGDKMDEPINPHRPKTVQALRLVLPELADRRRV